MPRRIPLPPELAQTPFAISEGRDHGLGEHRLRGKDLARPFHGVRVLEEPFRAESETAAFVRRCREYLPLLVDGRYFSHETAARLWGCPFPRRWDPSDPIHVTAVDPHGRPRGRGVSGHAVELVPPLDIRFGMPVSDPATTWLDMASRLRPDELVVIGDHLVHRPAILDPSDPRPYVSLDVLTERVDQFTGRGVRAARAALALVRDGSASRPETLLRLLLMGHGLPEPRLNADVFSEASIFLGRGDLVWPELRTVMEYDGDQHRTSTIQYEKDITRVDAFLSDGWNYVRVRKHGLFVDRADTVTRARTALARGGWRP